MNSSQPSRFGVSANPPTANLLQSIASHPGGIEAAIRDIEEKGDAKIRAELEVYLSAISPSDVASALADPTFRQFNRNTSDQDRAARIWAARQLLKLSADQMRLQLIRIRSGDRPPPYGSADFRTLDVDADYLAPLSALEYDGSRYSYKDSSALMLATTSAGNSTYWLAGHLDALNPESARIGLDPLLWGPKAEFPMMVYMMRVYGQALDWDRIGRLQRTEQGRWVAESPFSKGEITEYAWIPRDSEVHLEIEEIPQQVDAGLVGARYLHAVYDRSNRAITHLDGAVRVYSADEQRFRLTTHLVNVGKDGVRAKAFRVDGSLGHADFANVAASFYVWNYDVQEYFGNKRWPAAV